MEITVKIVPIFNVQIWVGLRNGYTDQVATIDDVKDICDYFVNDIKDCVTITETSFRYVDGHEPGVIVGYINYPRFERDSEEIIKRATELATDLMIGLEQYRVTITTPTDTIMLSNDNKM